MATIYDVPDTWVPDETYINSAQGIEYLAWQIGTDKIRGRRLWMIAPVVDTPAVDIVDLLPVDYTSYTLEEDVIRYGHLRSVLTRQSIEELEIEFLAEIDSVIAAIAAGTR